MLAVLRNRTYRRLFMAQIVALTGTGLATAVHYVTGLTPGDNTFTLAYRVSGNSGTFTGRNIVVIPMP